MKYRFKKGLVFGVTLLFLGLVFASNINANVTNNDEMVEVTTGFSNFGKKHTVQLTQHEAEELNHLFDNIKARLENAETREDTIEIFNEAIIELDKYSLLGGLSVRQIQKMVIGRFQNSRFIKVIEKIYSRHQGTLDVYENINCLVAGSTNNTWIMPGTYIMWMQLFPNFERLLWYIGVFAQIRPFYLFPFPNKPFPGLLIEIIEGTGWVFTIGMNGTKCWRGTLIGRYEEANKWGILGFIGINILLDYNGWTEPRHFYLGFARQVIIEEIE